MEDTIVIIPTLNEEENIGQIIPAILASCPGVSVLVADDNSRDRTQEIVRNLGVRHLSKVFLLARNANPGYGHSVLDGLRWAKDHDYKVAVSIDADFSHEISVIPKLRKMLTESGCGFALGSRYVKGGGVANWHLHRKILSRWSNFYVRSILNVPFRDPTSGFVAYSSAAMKYLTEANINSEGYSFLVETKHLMSKSGLSACECPIIFTDRREGQSKMSMKNIWEAIWIPWRLLFKSLIKG